MKLETELYEKEKNGWRKDTLMMIEGFIYMLVFIIIMEIMSAILNIPRIYGIIVMSIALLLVYREARVLRRKIQEEEVKWVSGHG